MFKIIFSVCMAIFAIIGLNVSVFAVYDFFRSGNLKWRAGISMEIVLTDETPAELLIETADYVRARYFPEMGITVSCRGVSEDTQKLVTLAAHDRDVLVQ